MGLFDALANISKEMNRAQSDVDVPYDFQQLCDKSLALYKADRLTPEKMAKLADYDTDLLQSVFKSRIEFVSGSMDEAAAIREIAKDALVIAIEKDL
jgi:hypothetical protein